jgi:hypothetical protein
MNKDQTTLTRKIKAQLDAVAPLAERLGYELVRQTDDSTVYGAKGSHARGFVFTPSEFGELRVSRFSTKPLEISDGNVMIIHRLKLLRMVASAVRGFDLVEKEDNDDHVSR